MIIVTGGAGMIGSNIVKALNKVGVNEIIIVDNLKDGRKIFNLNDLDFQDYIDKDDFLELIKNNNKIGKIKVVFHQGACSATTEWNGKYLMSNNYEYSKILLNWCIKNKYQFINASSASVYGLGENGFEENIKSEKPINPYAFSKFLFDQYIRKNLKTSESQIVSLRYFNVYGPREMHKGEMASTIYHFNNQFNKDNKCNLFEGTNGYKNGEQMRDFIYVEDCALVNLWFMENPSKSGIFNVGTGQAETFNSVANSIIEWYKDNKKSIQGSISYIPFPSHLKGHYQYFTKAEIKKLRNIGYKKEFKSLQNGINRYLNFLND